MRDLPVSMFGARAVLRKRIPRRVSDDELEELLVEMCSTRRLSIVFDEKDFGGT